MSIEWPTSTVLFACYFCFITGIISFLTTVFAIVAYFKSPTIRQAYQNLLLLNLLFNALIFSISAATFNGYGSIMGNSNILMGLGCSINGFLNVFCCCMEIYSLMGIALERYFAIVKQTPLNFNQIIGLLVFGWIECGLLAR
jgi:hypothetical protein